MVSADRIPSGIDGLIDHQVSVYNLGLRSIFEDLKYTDFGVNPGKKVKVSEEWLTDCSETWRPMGGSARTFPSFASPVSEITHMFE